MATKKVVPSLKDQWRDPGFWRKVMDLSPKVWRSSLYPATVDHVGPSPVLDPLFTSFKLELPDDLTSEQLRKRLREERVANLDGLNLEGEFEAWMERFVQAYKKAVESEEQGDPQRGVGTGLPPLVRRDVSGRIIRDKD